MKAVRTACAALVLVGSMAVLASAAEPSISKSKLSSMGLGSMRSMSDAEGGAVRGKFAMVWGSSSSNVLGQHGSNGYFATGHNVAVGASASVSGVGGSFGPFSAFVVGGTVGGSFAYAH
jgi:hypothetical protein